MIAWNHKRGEALTQSKLTEKDVLEIRAKYVPNSHKLGLSAMARKFGVDQSTIRSVVKFETWRHVGPEQ